MGDYKRRSQYSRPFLISGLHDLAQGRELARLTLSSAAHVDENTYTEGWLQRLLHRHPQSLPVNELEPAIGRLIPVGLELPTEVGYVDNLFVSPEGSIVLLECKLWRNPEARRRVISQIIDYAQSLARSNYESLDAAVRKSQDINGHPLGRSLIEVVRTALNNGDDFDEAAFIDALQQNLRMGRMLLLVVGDGIREDVESLVEYLQKHAGFHFTLGLLEVAIYKLPNGDLIIQPRVLARTLNIERAVVKLASPDLRAEPTVGISEGASAQSMSLTDDYFLRGSRRPAQRLQID